MDKQVIVSNEKSVMFHFTNYTQKFRKSRMLGGISKLEVQRAAHPDGSREHVITQFRSNLDN